MKLYHGTDEERGELRASYPNYSGSLGYGLYLTTVPEFAARFGRHVVEVESPVPDELVADITEPWAHECGDSLVMGTPGSTPFTFTMKDRKTGETERFSVLDDCEEAVKAGLVAQAIEEIRLPTVRDVGGDLDAEEQRLVSEGMAKVVEQLEEGETYVDTSDIVDDLTDDMDNPDSLDLEGVEDALTDFADEVAGLIERWMEKRLGTEVSLNELTKEMEALGYSALWIDGYAPGGDEYIIFDDAYLPLKVAGVP